MAESNMSPRKTPTTVGRLPLRENQTSNTNRETSMTSSKVSASPVKTRFTEHIIKPDTPAIPSVKSRLQRLADQRQIWNATEGTEVDSPQNVIPPNVIPPKRPDFSEDEVEEEKTTQAATQPKAPTASRSRFAALAASINSWEDDTNHPRKQFEQEKPATKKWQPPKPVESTPDSTPVPAKRSAPTAPTPNNGGVESRAPASMQPSPPKRTKYEEKENAVNREPSGRVGSVSDATASSDDSDTPREQPVPAPRSAKTAEESVKSPVKAQISSASPIKRPTLQSCTAVTPRIQSPKKQVAASKSPEKKFNGHGQSPMKRSPAKQAQSYKSSPTKQAYNKSPTKQAQVIKSSPVKQAFKTRSSAVPRKGATNENFLRARMLLEQGCGGGGASSRPATNPMAAPKVGAMAQKIQDRLKENERGWKKNTINTKIQEERQKELALIRARWEGNGAKGPKEQEKPTSVPTADAEDDKEEEEEMFEEQTEDETEEEESMEDEEGMEADESDMSATEDEEIVPTHATFDNTGFVAITMEKSSTPRHEEVRNLQTEEEAGDESVNISDVLGDIDELIVEAEAAMKEEEKNKEASTQGANLPPSSSSQADTSGWDFSTMKTEPVYDVPKPEPIYDIIPTRTNSSSSSSSTSQARRDEWQVDPVPAPRTGGKRRAESTDSSSDESCISTASSTTTPHSLESYRSQQQKVRSPMAVTHRTVTRETASRRVVREPSAASTASSTKESRSSSSSSSGATRGDRGSRQQQSRNPQRDAKKGIAGKRMSTKERIQMLMEEVSAQQSIIHQTSQALELIAATEEYHGTKEEIEAERLLVISTQRRQACLSEIQYLKMPAAKPQVLVTEDGEEIVPCRGSVTIKDIRLPLKTQYLMALDSGKDQPHHSYFVIVRCKEIVIATQLLSTRDISGDCLHFTNLVCLNDLGSDFTVELLVYEMRGRCATTDAVHAKKASSSKHGWSLTPKKFKSGGATLRHGGRYPQSPGPSGHSTVRQNSFATVGSARLTLASCQLKKVTLTKVPFLSPLDGSIHLTINCHTDSNTHAEGFLTMFDDCSGLGMWHRRWCVLHGGHLSFWKYPGDEKKKTPIGTVDLKECITKEVRLISRIHCARPNTFELETSRPSSRYDRDTLVSRHDNSHVITKHLLSADTKEDRVEWCTALNKVLLELRLWCNDAIPPAQE